MNTLENKNGSILIVEDDQVSIFIAETVLGKEFETRSVTNGYDAVKVMEEMEFDIVLMDINLGDERMDGIRTMRIIKQNRKHKYVKIFAVTAYSDDEQWFLKQGFDGLFLKPVNEQMRSALKETMIKKRTRLVKSSLGLVEIMA